MLLIMDKFMVIDLDYFHLILLTLMGLVAMIVEKWISNTRGQSLSAGGIRHDENWTLRRQCRLTLPFEHTTSVKDLSNHRSQPFPWSIARPKESIFDGSSWQSQCSHQHLHVLIKHTIINQWYCHGLFLFFKHMI